ncbi:MAG: glucose-6-phosphate dehydrogenase, partial [Sedimentisphaerales bacterium]|nr:glucose-6-phosphate dehydrogenase [Sedimentisphaerales bacterium]
MKRVEATAEKQEILCAETPAGPVSIVVFGASGDLACRKLYPSLYELYRRELMPSGFYVLGCGRSELSDDRFRDMVEESLENAGIENRQEFHDFLGRFYYESGHYDDIAFYTRIREKCITLDNFHNLDGCRIFYLSLPPFLYTTVTEKLRDVALTCKAETGRIQTTRLIVEKPFGSDLRTAKELDEHLHECFEESQIYRIDHYLGKETIQNLMVFRFTNSIFEPLWNRNFIDHVQITIAESVGVEHRAGYYDQSGALRDMFQNHLLQMVALVAMEPPAAFDADSVRDEKAKLLRSIRLLTPDRIPLEVAVGQYGPGKLGGQLYSGYIEEAGVDPSSQTETFVAAKLTVDNWRWKNVPFYLRTGKRLARKLTEIVIVFKQIPHSMFSCAGLDEFEP